MTGWSYQLWPYHLRHTRQHNDHRQVVPISYDHITYVTQDSTTITDRLILSVMTISLTSHKTAQRSQTGWSYQLWPYHLRHTRQHNDHRQVVPISYDHITYVTQDSTTITDRLFLSVMTISLTSHKTAQRSQTGCSYQLWPYHLRHTRQHNDHRQVDPISYDHITYVTQDSTTITDRLILSVMTISLTSHKTAQRSQTGWSYQLWPYHLRHTRQHNDHRQVVPISYDHITYVTQDSTTITDRLILSVMTISLTSHKTAQRSQTGCSYQLWPYHLRHTRQHNDHRQVVPISYDHITYVTQDSTTITDRLFLSVMTISLTSHKTAQRSQTGCSYQLWPYHLRHTRQHNDHRQVVPISYDHITYVTQDSTTITDRLFLSVMTISLTSHKTAQRSQTGCSYQLWPYHLRHTRQHNDHRQVVPISYDHITYVTQDSTTITDRLFLSVMTISLTSHKTAQRSQTGCSYQLWPYHLRHTRQHNDHRQVVPISYDHITYVTQDSTTITDRLFLSVMTISLTSHKTAQRSQTGCSYQLWPYHLRHTRQHNDHRQVDPISYDHITYVTQDSTTITDRLFLSVMTISLTSHKTAQRSQTGCSYQLWPYHLRHTRQHNDHRQVDPISYDHITYVTQDSTTITDRLFLSVMTISLTSHKTAQRSQTGWSYQLWPYHLRHTRQHNDHRQVVPISYDHITYVTQDSTTITDRLFLSVMTISLTSHKTAQRSQTGWSYQLWPYHLRHTRQHNDHRQVVPISYDHITYVTQDSTTITDRLILSVMTISLTSHKTAQRSQTGWSYQLWPYHLRHTRQHNDHRQVVPISYDHITYVTQDSTTITDRLFLSVMTISLTSHKTAQRSQTGWSYQLWPYHLRHTRQHNDHRQVVPISYDHITYVTQDSTTITDRLFLSVMTISLTSHKTAQRSQTGCSYQLWPYHLRHTRQHNDHRQVVPISYDHITYVTQDSTTITDRLILSVMTISLTSHKTAQRSQTGCSYQLWPYHLRHTRQHNDHRQVVPISYDHITYVTQDSTTITDRLFLSVMTISLTSHKTAQRSQTGWSYQLWPYHLRHTRQHNDHRQVDPISYDHITYVTQDSTTITDRLFLSVMTISLTSHKTAQRSQTGCSYQLWPYHLRHTRQHNDHRQVDPISYDHITYVTQDSTTITDRLFLSVMTISLTSHKTAQRSQTGWSYQLWPYHLRHTRQHNDHRQVDPISYDHITYVTQDSTTITDRLILSVMTISLTSHKTAQRSQTGWSYQLWPYHLRHTRQHNDHRQVDPISYDHITYVTQDSTTITDRLILSVMTISLTSHKTAQRSQTGWSYQLWPYHLRHTRQHNDHRQVVPISYDHITYVTQDSTTITDRLFLSVMTISLTSHKTAQRSQTGCSYQLWPYHLRHTRQHNDHRQVVPISYDHITYVTQDSTTITDRLFLSVMTISLTSHKTAQRSQTGCSYQLWPYHLRHTRQHNDHRQVDPISYDHITYVTQDSTTITDRLILSVMTISLTSHKTAQRSQTGWHLSVMTISLTSHKTAQRSQTGCSYQLWPYHLRHTRQHNDHRQVVPISYDHITYVTQDSTTIRQFHRQVLQSTLTSHKTAQRSQTGCSYQLWPYHLRHTRQITTITDRLRQVLSVMTISLTSHKTAQRSQTGWSYQLWPYHLRHTRQHNDHRQVDPISYDISLTCTQRQHNDHRQVVPISYDHITYVTQDSTTITDRLFLSVMTISLTSHKTAQRSQTGCSYQLWPYHLRHTRQHNDHRQVVPISYDHITYVTQDSTTITDRLILSDHITYVTQDSTTITDRLILSVMTISLTSHKTAQRSQTGWSYQLWPYHLRHTRQHNDHRQVDPISYDHITYVTQDSTTITDRLFLSVMTISLTSHKTAQRSQTGWSYQLWPYHLRHTRQHNDHRQVVPISYDHITYVTQDSTTITDRLFLSVMTISLTSHKTAQRSQTGCSYQLWPYHLRHTRQHNDHRQVDPISYDHITYVTQDSTTITDRLILSVMTISLTSHKTAQRSQTGCSYQLWPYHLRHTRQHNDHRQVDPISYDHITYVTQDSTTITDRLILSVMTISLTSHKTAQRSQTGCSYQLWPYHLRHTRQQRSRINLSVIVVLSCVT